MSQAKSYKSAGKQALFVRVKEAVVGVVNQAGGWSGYREHTLKAAVETSLGVSLSQAMFDCALRDSWEHDKKISCYGKSGNWSYFPKRDATFIGIDHQGTIRDIF